MDGASHDTVTFPFPLIVCKLVGFPGIVFGVIEELLSDDICGHNVLLQGPGLDNTTLRFADILSALGTKT